MEAPNRTLIASYADHIAVVYNSRDSREAANGLQKYINAAPASNISRYHPG